MQCAPMSPTVPSTSEDGVPHRDRSSDYKGQAIFGMSFEQRLGKRDQISGFRVGGAGYFQYPLLVTDGARS